MFKSKKSKVFAGSVALVALAAIAYRFSPGAASIMDKAGGAVADMGGKALDVVKGTGGAVGDAAGDVADVVVSATSA